MCNAKMEYVERVSKNGNKYQAVEITFKDGNKILIFNDRLTVLTLKNNEK